MRFKQINQFKQGIYLRNIIKSKIKPFKAILKHISIMYNKPKELLQIQEAERMYCSQRLSARVISEKIKCNIKTIYKWRDKYNWGKNGILFTDEEINTILQDVCLINSNDLRVSITNKLTQNRLRYFLQTDIINILSDVCLIKNDKLRIRLSLLISQNNSKYE